MVQKFAHRAHDTRQRLLCNGGIKKQDSKGGLAAAAVAVVLLLF